MLNFDKITKLIFVIAFFVGINHSDSNVTHHRELDEQCFKCRVSGECISEDRQCDGNVDCRDGSDESDCSQIRCPSFTFRCNYGACIAKSLVCDGKSDCRDGSDETTPDCPASSRTAIPLARKTRAANESLNGTCVLPEHPSHGQWVAFSGSQPVPGERVALGSILTVKCNKNYAYKGSTAILCLENGNWSENIGVCGILCQPIRNTTSTTVICTKYDFPIDCAYATDGTQAEFSCEPFYENRESTPPIRQCQEGSWDRPKPSCEPICGLKPRQPESLLAGGISDNTTPDSNPWHVSLYLNQQNPPRYLCSGTLISQNVILTAAHCVTNPKDGALFSKDQFTIAVGEKYQKFNDSSNINAQHSKLEEIYLMPRWRGEALLYEADIAVLITKDTLKLTQNVLPICMDYDGRVMASILKNPKPFGRIVSSVVKSGLLKEFKVPYVHQCLEKLPEDFQQFLTSDKFCAGFLNKDENVSIHNSGAGLTFQNPKDGRFYLAGISSLLPASKTGNYDPDQYALYTNVTQYIKIIIEKAARHYRY